MGFDRKKLWEEWYKKNKEEVKRKAREYYYKNKEKMNKYNKVYCKKNKEKVKEVNKKARDKYYATEKGKISSLNIRQIRRVRKLKIVAEKISIQDLKKIMEQQNNLCKNCGIYLNRKIFRFVHLDHIIPLSKGGGHILENLQYLCQKCNLTKGNKIYDGNN